MNPGFLLLLIVFIVLILIWNYRRGRASGDPDRFPIEWPQGDYTEAPRKEVSIGVERRDGVPVSVTVSPAQLVVQPGEQAAWSSREGKVEIRFSPRESPFGGASFTAARGGVALSGVASRAVASDYIVLLTTSDGFLLRQDAAIRTQTGLNPDSAS